MSTLDTKKHRKAAFCSVVSCFQTDSRFFCTRTIVPRTRHRYPRGRGRALISAHYLLLETMLKHQGGEPSLKCYNIILNFNMRRIILCSHNYLKNIQIMYILVSLSGIQEPSLSLLWSLWCYSFTLKSANSLQSGLSLLWSLCMMLFFHSEEHSFSPVWSLPACCGVSAANLSLWRALILSSLASLCCCTQSFTLPGTWA